MAHPLAKNRVLLVKETPVDDVLTKMVQKVTTTERVFLTRLETREKRTEALLDLLQRRGPAAVNAFCHALVSANREDLAFVLKDEQTEDMEICYPEESSFHLGGQVYLNVSRNGFTMKKDMQTIYFPVVRWISLRYALDDLDEDVHFLQHSRYVSFEKHLGGNVSVRAQSPSVHVKFWYKDMEDILLDFEQYEKLKDIDKVLPTFLPELNSRLPCDTYQHRRSPLLQ